MPRHLTVFKNIYLKSISVGWRKTAFLILQIEANGPVRGKRYIFLLSVEEYVSVPLLHRYEIIGELKQAMEDIA